MEYYLLLTIIIFYYYYLILLITTLLVIEMAICTIDITIFWLHSSMGVFIVWTYIYLFIYYLDYH